MAHVIAGNISREATTPSSNNFAEAMRGAFGIENPVYTMRTSPEHLKHPDGREAFGTWTGGLLGVVGRQIQDFNEFHKQWYINEMASER